MGNWVWWRQSKYEMERPENMVSGRFMMIVLFDSVLMTSRRAAGSRLLNITHEQRGAVLHQI